MSVDFLVAVEAVLVDMRAGLVVGLAAGSFLFPKGDMGVSWVELSETIKLSPAESAGRI